MEFTVLESWLGGRIFILPPQWGAAEQGSGHTLRSSKNPTQQRSKEQNNENEEQKFRDSCGSYGDSPEAEDCRDYRNHEKRKRPPQHISSFPRIPQPLKILVLMPEDKFVPPYYTF